jgi:hypothetical protein
MFESLKSLGKAVIGVVIETPVAIVADVATLGGTLADKDEPYTKTALRKVMQNIEKATEHD